MCILTHYAINSLNFFCLFKSRALFIQIRGSKEFLLFIFLWFTKTKQTLE